MYSLFHLSLLTLPLRDGINWPFLERPSVPVFFLATYDALLVGGARQTSIDLFSLGTWYFDTFRWATFFSSPN